MKLSKEYIMALSALIVVLGLIAGGYQFYYKARLSEYQENIVEKEKLEDVLTNLQETFNQTKPDTLIREIRGQIAPFEDALQQRARFFSVKDFLEIDPIPEGKMLGFYYREEFDRLFAEFRQEALRRFPTCSYPDITFGAPRPDEFTGVAVEKSEVDEALRKVKFGLSIFSMLMEAKAAYITDVQIWSPRAMDLFTGRIVGMSFAMMPKDLIAFLDNLRMGDRHVKVEGLSIQNKYLRWPAEPPVEVELLVTFLHANVGEQAAGQSGEAGGSPGVGGAASGQTHQDIFKQWRGLRGDDDEEEESTSRKSGSALGRFWEWIKGLWS